MFMVAHFSTKKSVKIGSILGRYAKFTFFSLYWSRKLMTFETCLKQVGSWAGPKGRVPCHFNTQNPILKDKFQYFQIISIIRDNFVPISFFFKCFKTLVQLSNLCTTLLNFHPVYLQHSSCMHLISIRVEYNNPP